MNFDLGPKDVISPAGLKSANSKTRKTFSLIATTFQKEKLKKERMGAINQLTIFLLW